MKRILLYLFLVLFISFCNAEEQSFVFLEFENNKLQATHEIPLAVRVAEGYQEAGPVNHTPTFNDHPFKVSLAAFVGDSSFIMVHAEKLADNSGTLDYSNLDSTKFKGLDFVMRNQCAELTDEIIDEEHDLSFLKNNNFELKPAVYLRQFLTTTEDRNSELVLSYGKRVKSCSDELDASFEERFSRELDSQIISLEMDESVR